MLYLTSWILFTLSPLAAPPPHSFSTAYSWNLVVFLCISFLGFILLHLSALLLFLMPSLCHSFSCRQMSATSPPPLSPSHLIHSSHLHSRQLHSSLPTFFLLFSCLSSFFPSLTDTQLSSPFLDLLSFTVLYIISILRHRDLIQCCPCDWYSIVIIIS